MKLVIRARMDTILANTGMSLAKLVNRMGSTLEDVAALGDEFILRWLTDSDPPVIHQLVDIAELASTQLSARV